MFGESQRFSFRPDWNRWSRPEAAAWPIHRRRCRLGRRFARLPQTVLTRRPIDTVHVGIDATSWRNDRGFGRFTRELVTALASRNTGFRYTLFFDQPPTEAMPAGTAVLSAATRRTLTQSAVGTTSRSPSYLWKMGRLVRDARCDLFFFPALYSYFPILARTPCVVCYHDTTAERLPHLLFPKKINHRLWQLKTAMARLQTTRAMTVSQSSASDLEQILGIPRQRIDVVTEAADPIFCVMDDPAPPLRARARYQIPGDATLLVCVGGMNAHKNVLGLLKALPGVIAREPAVHLAIVGDTSGKGFWDNVPELLDFVSSHPPLSQHVHFTGYIADPELVELLNGAAALVFPSLWEGFGLPAVEAMSCGVPVLASRRGSLPEVIGNAGLFFDPEDPLAISECLLHFVRNPHLHPQLRATALQRAQTFTWQRAAALAEECFRRCHDDASRRLR
jgi:glycosyltransferase involved in cell wall biosynthesis